MLKSTDCPTGDQCAPEAEFCNLDGVASLLRSRGASLWQLQPGRLRAEWQAASVGRLRLLRFRFSHAARLGFERINETFLIVPGQLRAPLRVNGFEVSSRDAALGQAAADESTAFEIVVPAGGSFCLIELGSGLLHEARWYYGHCDKRPVAVLTGRGGELGGAADEGFRPVASAEELELKIVDAALRAGRELGGQSPAPGSTSAVALIETLVTNFLRTHEPVSLVEMCRVTGFSRRALTYAFQKRYGVPPKRFFRNLALNAVRDELLASRGTVRVSEIAPFYGFSHMSQFAADYKNQFGELPSETLTRARWEGRGFPKDRAVPAAAVAFG